jgi:putative ABC transport system permease protein
MSDRADLTGPRPDWGAAIRSRLAGLDADPRRLDDIVDELGQHLDDRYDELRDAGLDTAAAQRTALEELAAPHVLGRALRPVALPPAPPPTPLGAPAMPGGWLTGLRQDIRDGLRSLRASPGLSAVALLTLALGIGASVAIFSVVNAVLLRPLPFAEPDRLVAFWATAPQMGVPHMAFPDALYSYFGRRGRDLSPVAAYAGTRVTVVGGDGDPERISGAAVTANFFATLGRTPLRGRAFQPAEEAPRQAKVVVIGHGLWQRRFGGDPGIVGSPLRLADGTATIVGVMPSGFDFPNRSEIWMPLATDPQSIDCWCNDTIGRLAPGRTAADAAREMARLNDDFWRERQGQPARDLQPKDPSAVIIAAPLADTLSGDVRRPLLILLAAVGIVLLIACANIANLLLARAGARAREIAVRACLGASPWRVARQLFVESVLLALGGAIGGLMVAAWGARGLGRLAAERLSYVQDVPIDPLVLGFTLAIASLTVVVFGVAPAVRAARVDAIGAGRDGSRTTRSAGARRLADGFVVGQVALSLVLLVGAVLLLRSLGNLLAIDPGFRPEHVLVGRLTLPTPDRPAEVNLREGRAFYAALSERIGALPGVTSFGLVSVAPFSDGGFGQIFTVKGREPAAGEPTLVTQVRAATPGYRSAIGLALKWGRWIEDRDQSESPLVVVVDETLAHRYWPDGSALGHDIRLGRNGPWRTIVGVVASVKHGDLGADAQRYVYVPHVQAPFLERDLVVRTSIEPGGLAAAIRHEIRTLDPGLPFYDVHTLDDAVARSVGTRQLTNRTLAAFSLAALVLAAVGIYGVIALNVSQRVQEFGVRVALGASRPAVLGLVLRQGLRLVLLGVALGLAATAWLTRYLGTLLFGVAPLDPLVIAGATVTLIAVALIACYVPARRATRIDPLRALRTM